MRKLGIAAKIYLAFGSIILMAAVASSIGWKGFERVTESQNSVIDQAIPGLRQAHRLSALNASIGAASASIAALRAMRRNASRSVRHCSPRSVRSTAYWTTFNKRAFHLMSLQSLRETVSDIEEQAAQTG